MRVKKRLQIAATVSVVIAVVIGLTLSISLYRIGKANNTAKITGEIMAGSFERATLINDYIHHNSARAKEQWFAKHEEIGGIFASISEAFDDAEDRKIAAALIQDNEAIGRIFSAMVANREEGRRSHDLSREVEERLVNQLNMRLYEVGMDGRKLLESTRVARDSAIRLAGWSIIIAFLVLLAMAMLNLQTLGRSITERVRMLRDGAMKVGEGDLGYRIGLKGDDEFVEISGAFDAMTSKLGEAQTAVQQERDRLSALVNSITDEIWFADAEENLTLVNPAVWKEFGALPGDDWKVQEIAASFEVYRPDGTPRPVEEAPPLRALQGETVIGQEEIVRTPASGQLRHRQINAAPVRDPDGTIIGSVSVVRDITARKQAEQALRESETKYRNLFQNMTEEVHFWQLVRDEDDQIKTWRLVDANPPTLRTWGRDTIEEIRGKTTDEIFGPGATEHYMPVVRKIMEEGVPYSFEDYFPHLDKHFRFTSVPLGEYFITTGADITGIKKAHEALATSLHEKEVLLKEIHHRVKNNLQIISSLVSLQADSSKDETVRQMLRDVTDRVRSMALVHEKLYQSADLAYIDFPEYVRSLLNYLWRAHGATAASVRLTLEMEPLSLPVGTAVPCGLILNELAGNALTHAFRDRTEGEVTVSLRKREDRRVCLAVSDNGVGLPPGLDWRKAPSLGLRLVQLLAGQLDAEVNVSGAEGTRFEIIMVLPV